MHGILTRCSACYGMALVTKASLVRHPIEVSVSGHGIKYPVYLRLRTTDVSVLTDILLKCEHGLELAVPPRVIIDAGAAIGMASVCFANKLSGKLESSPLSLKHLTSNCFARTRRFT